MSCPPSGAPALGEAAALAAGPRPADPRRAMTRLMHPAVVDLYSAIPPLHARRSLAGLLLRLGDELLPPGGAAQRDELIAANAAALGVALDAPGAARRLVRRHLWLEAQSRADDWLLAFGDLTRVVPTLLQPSRCEGLEHAVELARRGGPVVVVGAHVGPMSHYVPCLAYHLARAGGCPRIVSVANGPAVPGQQERLLHLQRLAGASFEVALKDPGRTLSLLRTLHAALGAGAWVLTQVDALSAGATTTPLTCAGLELRLPGAWGAARLAWRFGAALLPVRVVRDRHGLPLLHVEAPLRPLAAARRGGSPTSRRETVAALASAAADRLGQWIQRDVADWSLLARLRLMMARR